MSHQYCSVVYFWRGRGWNQQIEWVRIEGKEAPEWAGRKWSDFLNHMSLEGWELATAISMSNLDPFHLKDDAPIEGLAAYFRRPC